MKRSAKGSDSESRILEAAIELIAENGYKGTKISDIVKAAGLTQAAFYLYFPSKEAIFQEILERFYLKLEKYLQAAAVTSETKPDDFPSYVTNNIEAVFELFQEHPQLTKIFLTEERSMDEVENLIRPTIVSNLIHNQTAGFIRNDLTPEIMANCMIGMFIQVVLRELIENRRQPRDAANQFTQVLLFGLSRK